MPIYTVSKLITRKYAVREAQASIPAPETGILWSVREVNRIMGLCGGVRPKNDFDSCG